MSDIEVHHRDPRWRVGARSAIKTTAVVAVVQVVAVILLFVLAPRDIATHTAAYFYFPALMIVRIGVACGFVPDMSVIALVVLVVPSLGICVYSVIIGALVGVRQARSEKVHGLCPGTRTDIDIV